jgi:drug/metabolite transporter (DMT)-like permease
MLYCLASAAAFGAMGIFGKLAYDEGATVGTLLAIRFSIAALVFWALGGGSGLRRDDLIPGLALGAVGYSLQAGLYFAALERVDASLLSLVLFTYPAIVAAAAVLLGRDRLDRYRVGALALALGGLVLVVGGAGTGSFDTVGIGLGLGAAIVYSGYILISEGIARRLKPYALAALVCTGAAVTLTTGSAALGQLRPDELTAAGWGWIACLALISTVAAIGWFFAGLRRVGPTITAILGIVEPFTTVALAFVVFGEALGPGQMLGGVLVIAAVLVLNLSRRRAAPPTAASP